MAGVESGANLSSEAATTRPSHTAPELHTTPGNNNPVVDCQTRLWPQPDREEGQ